MNDILRELGVQFDSMGDFMAFVIGALFMLPMVIAAWYTQRKKK